CLSSAYPFPLNATARVCDNELLRCQNGGVCVNNIRCQCPPAYTGLLTSRVAAEGRTRARLPSAPLGLSCFCCWVWFSS
ncbi:hypothetical protein M9458_047722, partial [Cirrhinus mrigala]